MLENNCHVNIICNNCKNKDFQGDRYKCYTCPGYDLCSKCYEFKKFEAPHKINHPMIYIGFPVKPEKNHLMNLILENKDVFQKYFPDEHQNKCDSCGLDPIKGLRIKCDECHDYDLC